MDQSRSWEANSHSTSQEILHTLWNQKVNYRVQNTTLLVPIRNQMHQDHTFQTYLPKILSNIIPIYAYIYQFLPYL